MERYTLCGLIIILSLGGTIQSEADAKLKFKPHPKSTDTKDIPVEHVLQPDIIPLDHEHEMQAHVVVERMTEEPIAEIRMIHHDTQEVMDFEAYRSMLEEEAARHVETVAKDSKKKEDIKLEAGPTEPEHTPEAEAVRELPGKHLRDENIKADHEGSKGNEQNDSEKLTHIYMKPIAPPVDPEDLPDIIVHHQEDEEFVHRIVYLHSDRHEHVVHKGRDYATLTYHDEM